MGVRVYVSFILGMCLLFASQVGAVPVLQLYVEGGTYDPSTETWVAAGGDTIRLWCIGNVAGEGGHGAIFDVRLAIAYADPEGSPVNITLTPNTTGGYGGFTDPSTPSAPTFIQTVTDGSRPVLSDGNLLEPHGIYGVGTFWQEFLLGDLALTDSPIADFITTFPAPGAPNEGEISVYEVTVTGTDWVHFDLYDATESPVHAWFAPYSHDAETGPPVPEPGTVALISLGTMILAGSGFRRRRR